MIRSALVTRAGQSAVAISMTLAIAMSSTALAQDLVVRDVHGRRTATIDQEGPAGYVVRDNAGRRTGTISPDTTGRFVTRDRQQDELAQSSRDRQKVL